MAALLWAFISRLPLPVIAVVAVLGFYEGVPGLSSIPYIDKVPFIGRLAIGRVGMARLEGAQIERQKNMMLALKQRAARDAKRRETQAAIDVIARQYLTAQATITAQTALFQKGISDADYLCSGPVITGRLSDRLDAIGRQ